MESLLPGLTSAPNLHPMVVHFAIAFWLAATLAWSWALLRRSEETWRFGLWLHTFGAAGAIVAVLFGFQATGQMGHDTPGHDLVHVHRDIMLAASGLSIVLTGLAWWRRSGSKIWRSVLMAVSVLLVGTMTIGADRGAELVFRYGIGVVGETPPATSAGEHGQHSHDPSQHDH